MNEEVRDKTVGELTERVFALENKGSTPWEHLFGKKPWVVLSTVVVVLSSGFWFYHTWQIERIDKQNQQEMSRILKENESRIVWLKEQQKTKLESENDKCEIEKQRITAQLESCIKTNKKYDKRPH